MGADPPAVLSLAADEVHVWRIPLDVEAQGDELDAHERERAAKFRFERDRRTYIAAHAAMRRILGWYLGCPGAGLVLARSTRGKPFLETEAAPALRFNLSHSGRLALLAVSHIEVGADVELIRENADAAGLAKRFFPAPEYMALLEAEPGEQQRVFFRLWTRREAFLKARGTGLERVSDEIPAHWHVVDLDPDPGYAGAVAWEGPGARVVQFRYSIRTS